MTDGRHLVPISRSHRSASPRRMRHGTLRPSEHTRRFYKVDYESHSKLLQRIGRADPGSGK